MAKIRKIKTDAATVKVPQNRDQVNEYIADIGRLQRERERLRADMNDEIAVIKQRYEEAALPLAEWIRERSYGVQIWCEANRAELTGHGKVKYAMLAAGKVNWRTRPPKVMLRGKERIIEAIKALSLGRFLRVAEDVNKEAMLAEPDLAASIDGVSIVQSEDFVITPFETDLEEVA